MKNKIMYTLVGVLCVIVVSLGVTLAYWLAGVSGTGEKITIELANNLRVVLNDPAIVTETGVEPGWSVSKTFTVENQGNGTTSYNIVIENLVNTLVSDNYLQYKITSDTGYNMSEYASVPKASESTEEVLAYNVSIEGKVIHSYTIEFRYIESNTDQSEDMGKMFSGNLSITEGSINTLYNKILSDNFTIYERFDFDSAVTKSNINTIFKEKEPFTEDIDGDRIGETVYYFVGNAQNNWVKFGKDSSGVDLYWRIIRTNEDKGVRLLYVGTSMDTAAGYIGSAQAYNSASEDAMSVGYMYGSTGSLANNRTNENDSKIKGIIDTWYESSINAQTDGKYTYNSYVSKTAIYCNDRATSSYNASSTMYYAAYDRLNTNKQPSYKCGVQINGALYESTQSTEDKFSASTASGGNGQLTYPVALMTADEVMYAGNGYSWHFNNSTSNSASTTINSSVTSIYSWWTMTPSYFGSRWVTNYTAGGNSGAGVHVPNSVANTNTIRPVLSLKSCVTYKSGNGSSSTPYEVQLSETCANSEN